MDKKLIKPEDIVISFVRAIEDEDAFQGKGDDIADFALMIIEKDFEGMKELLDDKIINLKDFSYEYLDLCVDQYKKNEDKDYLKIMTMFIDRGAILYDQNDKLLFNSIENDNEKSNTVFDFLYECYQKNDEKMLKYDPKVQKFKLNFEFKKRLLFNSLAQSNFHVLSKLKSDTTFFSSFRMDDAEFKNKLVTLLINIAHNSSHQKANDIFFAIFRQSKLMTWLEENQALRTAFEDRKILSPEVMKDLVLFHAL